MEVTSNGDIEFWPHDCVQRFNLYLFDELADLGKK